MPEPSRAQHTPDLHVGDPTEDNAFMPIAVGTIAWTVAGIVLLALLLVGNEQIADQRWWLSTCAVGCISGIGGLIYVKRRAGRPQRAAARAARTTSANEARTDPDSQE